MKTGHVLKNCLSLHKRCCDHCGKWGYHNRCLCPEKFSSGESNTDAFCVAKPDSVVDSNSIITVGASPESASTEQSTNDQADTNLTQTLLAFGERVLLQATIVPILSADGKTLINAWVLLDSASQRTFMTTKFAQQLKLSSRYREHLLAYTFGAERARDVETYVVNFKVKVKDGSYLLLSANVLKQITSAV